jgi:hypothetical protein
VLEVTKSPSDFVTFLTAPGLTNDYCTVPIKSYMCLSAGNGGNDTASSLLGQLRWMKDGGTTLNQNVDPTQYDIALKGQGHPNSIIKIMSFIIKNKAAVAKLRIEVAHREKGPNWPAVKEWVKVVDWTGTVDERYFRGRTDRDALVKMVEDKVFGFDCIGFVSNYLINAGVWDTYHGYEIDQWPNLFSNRILKAEDIDPLCILIWPGSHIAIVDKFVELIDENTCVVNVCQSSTGGPQLNELVRLKGSGGRFAIDDRGSPAMPVVGTVTVHKMPGLRRVYKHVDLSFQHTDAVGNRK